MKDTAHYERYYINHIEDGEWLQYTIDVKQKGIYSIGLSVASDTTGGMVSIRINQKHMGGQQNVPAGGAKKWTTTWFKNISLVAGRQTLRVYADKGGFQFSAISFDRTK